MHEGIGRILGQNVEGLVYSETAESNIFLDFTPPAPDRMVAIFPQAGGEADSKLPYDPVDFQVITRCEMGSDWAFNMSRAIYAELHGKRNTTLPGGTYLVFCIGSNPMPIPLAPDANGRQVYSMDFRTEIINHTKERP